MDTATDSRPPDVLIAGAGPTGLALACELARHGLRLRIIDQKSGPSEHSKALGIQPRSLELLEKIDVTPHILARGRRIHALHIHGLHRDIARLSVAPLDTHYDFLLALPQSDTEALLIERLSELGVQVEWQTALSRLDTQPDAVHCTLNAADHSEHTLDVPWVAGCDGIHSTVRSAVNVPFEGEEFPEWFVLADVHANHMPSADEAHAWLSPDGPLAAFPLPGSNLLRVVASIANQPLDQRPTVDLALIENLVKERTGESFGLSKPEWLSSFLIQRRIVTHFRSGRVLLAGDAAHVHSPVGGQGMNLGIQDAFNLGWKLALVVRGQARPELLDSYEQERRPVDAATVDVTRVATNLITLHNRWLRRLRDILLHVATRQERIRRSLVSRISGIAVGYPKSPIVGQSDALRRHNVRHAPRPGERAPDITWPSPDSGHRRLFDVFRGTRHVLLYFAGEASQPEAIDALAGSLGPWSSLLDLVALSTQQVPAASWKTLFDAGAAAHERYGASQPMLYLVRPDGYVAWRGFAGDVAALQSYLRGLFVGVTAH